MRHAALICLATILLPVGPRAQADALPSWNDGPSKQAITSFVGKVTAEGSSDFVKPAERIAVFDNDGCLWAEQPMYFQLLFAIDRVKALAPKHAEWKETEPFASLLKGDVKAALAGGEKAILQIIMATHAGMSTDEFDKIVTDWIATARHPVSKRPYTEMVYQPMLELLAYLRAHGFKTFIVSGGGVEFMRPWVERVYGIPPEQVVGSSGVVKFELKDGTPPSPVLMKEPKIEFIDDGPGKPVGIHRFIGRRPVMAFGNSDGDLQMLQWTTAGEGPRFGLIVHHTDAGREFAYDRDSHIGRLDKGLDEAKARGWTVVDMKAEWNSIFPPQQSPTRAGVPATRRSRNGAIKEGRAAEAGPGPGKSSQRTLARGAETSAGASHSIAPAAGAIESAARAIELGARTTVGAAHTIESGARTTVGAARATVGAPFSIV